MKRVSVSLHRSPIKVRSGAVANAKIARDLVPANKVSGAIERGRILLDFAASLLDQHAVSTWMDRYLMVEVDFEWWPESQKDGGESLKV